ncbi:bis(5'-nucleosyl)-tetraphosphatase [asymmetrical] [Cylas formicarius]|uniref:bis(5'-nucleosyl)-tetraphosphatase [asymmetrical] n=1 Tax=Cylas formicarius TaxID=197179 RepID=UPI002958D6D8|nr:bis(5'-nucleosyl)-tetraphosphatase [asymmetrical] [Cylas formicarius]
MVGKVAAGFVIFRRKAAAVEYLLLQTSYGIHHWTPPKGHVDPGETELVTAFRETWEEAGLEKTDLKIFQDCAKILHYNVNNKPKTVHYWLAELINPNADVKLSHEHQAYKWLPLKEACDCVGYKDMQDVLVQFEKYLAK